MDARTDLQMALDKRRQGYSLDQRFYTDPDFFQQDLELIWYREWLFAGHDGELARPGSFFTLKIGDYPVIVLRDRQGQVRAFHNSCRHRGSLVCTAKKGMSARLVCPYHQWTYDLDGSLVFARQMGPGFDPASFGLKPVACEAVAGYIFVSLAETPRDFAPLRALMEPYLAPHRLADAKVVHESNIIERGNWKLVWENNRECYHCAGNHPELCKSFPETPTLTDLTAIDSDPDLAALWQRSEAAGLPARFRADADGQYRLMRVPLLGEAVSYTMTGKAAVRRRLSDVVPREKLGALLLYHYPTTWNHVLDDHAVTFRVTPLSATETQVTTKWLVHRDAVAGIDYDLDTLIHVWRETNDQDRRVVEDNAQGIASPAYEPGPYSPIHEGGVLQFVEWYVAFIQSALSGSPAHMQSVA
ncbi:MAG: aromatic ring-hydroxylating dioxygenase subunit alpha [Pseudomonadota bacterium]